MSKTQDQNTSLQCDECNEIVVLERNERRELKASCACDERNVKVSKATPMEW